MTMIATSTTTMTWHEFDAVAGRRDEYIDGARIVNASPRKSHQSVAVRIRNLLDEATSDDFEAVEAWSWKPGDDAFIPDVLLIGATDEDVRSTGIPELVVEVLSSDRAADLVVRARKYAERGLPRFWVVDVPARTVTVFRLDDDAHGFVEVVVITDGPPVAVDIGGATVEVDPMGLFGKASARPV